MDGRGCVVAIWTSFLLDPNFLRRKEAGTNMVHFIRRLRELVPGMIITQPTYGYPHVRI